MQNELLDITIIGCLALLFASTYRKRATPMVRSWTLGWALILVHFTALLFHPANAVGQGLLIVTSLGALIACSIVFLIAAFAREGERPNIFLPILGGSAAIVFCAIQTADVRAPLPYFVTTVIGALCWTACCLQLPGLSTAIRSLLIVACCAAMSWLLWTIVHGQEDVGVSAILSGLYLCVALTYLGTFRRLSGGTVTVIFGLLAWAAVFPAAEFCNHLGIIARISPEFWNVPKYFVAFGMILILLEEEILAANHQARHDRLTGLPNRGWLEDQLRHTLQTAGEQGTQVALICLDVDRFKQINDTYGHTIGDACLQEVGRRLKPHIGAKGTAARIGGEEFSILLQDLANTLEAEQVAANVLLALQAPIQAHNYTIELTASVGISVFPTDGQDAATLWRNADSAMYRAKRAGGNQFLSMSPEIAILTSEANVMELFVRQALKTGAYEVHYQPLYKISGELHSLEALIRLRHPEQGLVSPQRFIAIAEERGLIVPLGEWLLNEICEQLNRWKSAGLPAVRVDMNISPVQITRPDFATSVLEVLTTHRIDPRLIGMEITETAMMRNLPEASRQIELLAAVGIAFSIDDFGTGYSSLGQLDKLPVQSLKIDRTFIDRICLSDGTYSIVDAVVRMGHSLGLSVVAEGVEDHEQWACLRHLGCDIIQGFLFSKPLQASDVPAQLQDGLKTTPVQPKITDRIHVA
jgi:diguanylate cyclase (GGDEF)-like protein